MVRVDTCVCLLRDGTKPSASDTNAYKRAAIGQVGHCVTKDVQGLHLATFHSMTAVGIQLVVEGH